MNIFIDNFITID